MAIPDKPTVLQVILVIPIFIWAVVSLIMTLEDENRGKRATSSFDWIVNHAPRWQRRVFFFVVLPLICALLLCRHFGW
jgi:hypothetical protein